MVGPGGYALAVHGGAGTLQRSDMSPEQAAHYHAGLRRALAAGRDVLQTVGAVARDRAGNLAAATSTGGMTGKARGRVGDSPIIGAGTYADDETCAVSATGHGEFFIRWGVAHEIAARMRHAGQSLGAAARA